MLYISRCAISSRQRDPIVYDDPFLPYSIIIYTMEKHKWHRAAISNNSQQPAPRWGHASTIVNQQVVLFGGYADTNYMNDLWAYDTARMEWQEIKTSGAVPSPRSNSTLHYDAVTERLVLFGGGGPNKFRYNDVRVMDWASKEWKVVLPAQGERMPWERTYHSSQLLYPYLLVFGGEGIADLEDLWAFNLQTSIWHQLPIDKTKQRPCARRFHSSAIIGSSFYVIAGCHDKYHCLSDVYSIDLRPFVQDPSNCRALQWKQAKLKGSAFLTRWGHTSAVYNDKIYIFGGRFSSDLQDILVLDFQNEIIKTMKVQGEVPKPRRRHSASFVGSSLLIFGGFNGQYFNDLNYINVFELAQKKEENHSQSKDLKCGWINRRFLSDFQVKTKENLTFYGHKGFVMDKFHSQTQFSLFLQEIDGGYSTEQLYQLFHTLYTGIGNFPQRFYSINFSPFLFANQHDKDTYFRKCVTDDTFQPSTDSLLSKPAITSRVISLSAPLYSDFLDSRASIFHDFYITLNQQYCLPANKALLAVSSTYFQYLFKHNPHINELHVDLSYRQFGDVRVFQVLLNYLQTKWMVVPQGLDEGCWMCLLQLADYFCLQGVRKLCEGELIAKISGENCQELLDYAMKENLEDLQAHCVEFLFKGLLEKEDGQLLKQIRDKQHKSIRETALYELYKLWQFDLAQTQLKRQQTNQTSKIENPQGIEKQNHETLLN